MNNKEYAKFNKKIIEFKWKVVNKIYETPYELLKSNPLKELLSISVNPVEKVDFKRKEVKINFRLKNKFIKGRLKFKRTLSFQEFMKISNNKLMKELNLPC